jgi:3-hydroxymyristoyl/3-hydroxydecanoyl-(acyl carrier protein) dehydratase
VTANPTRPEAVSVNAGPRQLSLTLKVPASLPWFRGHFEHYPILPGVVQLAWALSFAREHFGFEPAVARIAGLKFSRVIQPEAELRLDLDWSADERALDFRLSERDSTCSSGRFILAR